MSMLRSRMIIASAASVVLVLAGCGSDASTKTTSTKSAKPARTTTQAKTTENPPDPGESDTTPKTPRAPIEVTHPQPLDQVSGSFLLSGTANVTEATVSWELVKARKAVRSGYVTASCGSGCRGKFRKRISLSGLAPGSYTLLVFEASAKDGSHLHQVVMPLTVASQAQKDPGPPPGAPGYDSTT